LPVTTTAPPTEPGTPLAATKDECRSVWGVAAVNILDGSSRATCGERITYLQGLAVGRRREGQGRLGARGVRGLLAVAEV